MNTGSYSAGAPGKYAAKKGSGGNHKTAAAAHTIPEATAEEKNAVLPPAATAGRDNPKEVQVMDKMKKRRFAAFLVAAALLLMVGMTGCTGGCSASNNGMSASIGPGSSGSGSSSSYSSSNGSGITGDPDPDHSSSYASSDYPSSSGSSDLSGSSDTMDGSSGTGSSDMMDDILDDITDGDRLPEGSSS